MNVSMPPSRNRSRWRRWLPRRFVVADRSMEPALVDGQGLIGVRWRRRRVGQIRCVEHPDRPGFWLVKRIDDVFDDGTISVLSDNLESTRADSRTFGPVPAEGSYLIVFRVPRRLM